MFVQPLPGIGAGAAVTWGDKTGTLATTELPTLRSAGQAAFFTYRAGATLAETAVAAGGHTRVTAHGHAYWGPAGVLAEWVRSSQTVALGMEEVDVASQAWQVSAQVVLGGKPSFKGVAVDHRLGALELAARYTGIRVDEDVFPVFADPARAASGADAFAAGLSWHANRQLKLVLDFERTSFEGEAARPAEIVFLGRAQTVF